MDDVSLSFGRRALDLAAESVRQGGFPAGAVLVKDGRVVGEGLSLGNKLFDPSSHGEMVAIRTACESLQSCDLQGAVLYSSMQPCLMCMGAAQYAGISALFYACSKGLINPVYYAGTYDSIALNQQLSTPFRFVHLSALEADSLALVRGWEVGLGLS